MANTPPIIPSVPPVANGLGGVGSQQNPPPAPQLPPGTVVQGTVVGADSKGNPVIQNEALQLVLNTRFPMNKGAQVTIRVDPPVTRDALPSVRILNVDGIPTSQQTQAQNQASSASTPAANVQSPAQQQAQTAAQNRPVGLLLDVMARGDAPPLKAGGAEAAAQQTAQQPAPHVRGAAADVQLSAGQKAEAVLLRPELSPRAANLLSHLAAQNKLTLPQNALSALRPGMQMQVQLVQTAPPAASPATPASGAATTTPSTTAPQTAAAPVIPPQARTGYAQYARQAPAPMPASGAAGAGAGQSSAPPVGQPAPVSPSLVAGASQMASPATPVNVASGITPQMVEQLLVRAETQPLPQGQMAAVVMGKEQGGALIVQTRLGMFTLPQVQAGNAQAGSVLIWTVDEVQLPQPAAMTHATSSAGLLAAASQFTTEWSALEELSTLLHGMQSSMAAQTLQRMVPHLGSNFSAGLLFFMNILRRGGDITEWMGRDMVDHLERMGKGDLVQRLAADMGAIRTLFAEQPAGQWQALFFPVMVDKQLEHAQMFIKPDEQQAKGGGKGTRFIVELELSNLGPMQMDGLVKKRDSRTHFDLVIRTMQELPDAMRGDIIGIFDNAQQATGLGGSINFRLVQEFPVNPLQEIQQSQDGEGGIIA